jgi:hypothetical protein
MLQRPPVFIVGAPRSGTTLLRLILDSHPHISCGPETHFLTDLTRILTDHWPRVERYGFDRAYWEQRIAKFFDSFQQDYADRRGKRRWADKTPRYTTILPLIDTLFPQCQVVHLIRNGRDVVASHRRRWGYWRALRAAATWRTYVTAARCFGQTLPADRYVELRYEALVSNPEGTLRPLFEFLNEPWDPAVVPYDEASHDVSGRHARLTESRRQAGGETEAIYRSRIGAGSRELGPLLKLMFRIRAGQLNRELGYC